MKSTSDVGLGDERKQFLIRSLYVATSDRNIGLLESAIIYTFQISISFAEVDIDECLMLDGCHGRFDMFRRTPEISRYSAEN